MTMFEIDAWLTKLAGVLGACASLFFMRVPWTERIVMAVGGAIVSYYASPWMSARTGLPEGLSGFLLGLFGMTVCAKAWEVLHQTPIAEMWTSVLDGIRNRISGGGR